VTTTTAMKTSYTGTQPTWNAGKVMSVRPVVIDTAHYPLSVVRLTTDSCRVQLTSNPHRVGVHLGVGTSHRCNTEL